MIKTRYGAEQRHTLTHSATSTQHIGITAAGTLGARRKKNQTVSFTFRDLSVHGKILESTSHELRVGQRFAFSYSLASICLTRWPKPAGNSNRCSSASRTSTL